MKTLPQEEMRQLNEAMIWAGDIHPLLLRAQTLAMFDGDFAANTRDCLLYTSDAADE